MNYPKTPGLTPAKESRNNDIEGRMKIELRDIGIPPRPQILQQIEAETSRDDPDFIHLANIINSDVGLSAGLIKTANSPFFSFGKKVRTAQEALLVLGLKLVVNAIAGLALQQIFKHIPNMERFWDASANSARVTGWLGKRLKGHAGVRSEDAFTFALFRDCGIPVLMVPFPEYRTVLNLANNEKVLSFTEVEDEQLSINHAVVGAELAENWLLPDDLCLAIRHHHDRAVLENSGPTSIPERSRVLIAMAQLAEHLIHQQNSIMQTCEWEKLGPATLNILGLSEDDLPCLIEASRLEVFAD